jgi:hypothetical protein
MQEKYDLVFEAQYIEEQAQKYELLKCGKSSSFSLRNSLRNQTHTEMRKWIAVVITETQKPARLGTIMKRFAARFGQRHEQIRDRYARIFLEAILSGKVKLSPKLTTFETQQIQRGASQEQAATAQSASLERRPDVPSEVFTPFAALDEWERLFYSCGIGQHAINQALSDGLPRLAALLIDAIVPYDAKAEYIAGSIIDLRLTASPELARGAASDGHGGLGSGHALRKALRVRLSDLTAIIGNDPQRLALPQWLEAKFGIRSAELNRSLAEVLTRCALAGERQVLAEVMNMARTTGDIQRRGEANYSTTQAYDEGQAIARLRSVIEDVLRRLSMTKLWGNA